MQRRPSDSKWSLSSVSPLVRMQRQGVCVVTKSKMLHPQFRITLSCFDKMKIVDLKPFSNSVTVICIVLCSWITGCCFSANQSLNQMVYSYNKGLSTLQTDRQWAHTGGISANNLNCLTSNHAVQTLKHGTQLRSCILFLFYFFLSCFFW